MACDNIKGILASLEEGSRNALQNSCSLGKEKENGAEQGGPDATPSALARQQEGQER